VTSRALRIAAPLAGLAALLAGAAALAQDNGPPLPDGPGKAELVASCTSCHGVGQIVAQHLSPDGWTQVVTTMVGYGAEVTPAQQTAIVGYLSTNFGAGAAASTPGAPGAPPAPPSEPPAGAQPPQGAPTPPSSPQA
jgi:hypothetical protein